MELGQLRRKDCAKQHESNRRVPGFNGDSTNRRRTLPGVQFIAELINEPRERDYRNSSLCCEQPTRTAGMVLVRESCMDRLTSISVEISDNPTPAGKSRATPPNVAFPNSQRLAHRAAAARQPRE